MPASLFKWFVREDGHRAALRLLEAPHRLAAPDLIVAQVADLVRGKVLRGEIGRDQGYAIALAVGRYIPRLVPAVEVAARSLAIALMAGRPVSDGLYVAVAEATGARLVTADRCLYERLQGTPFAGLVEPLETFPGAP